MASGLAQLARAVLTRKPALVPSGVSVGRLEARLTVTDPQPARLERYRELVAWRGEGVPLAWPHVLASGLHLEVLSQPRFPVRLLGLVHVGHRIELLTALPASLAGAELLVFLEGYRDTERGHEFELHTELRAAGVLAWRECTTFLARKKRSGAPAPSKSPPVERPAPQRTVEFDAPAGLGRRYARVGGDPNPIHLYDLTAKLFGFRRAIAHGMWSLARCASELSSLGAPCTLEVQFKLPVFMPARLKLELRGDDFMLVGSDGKPHLTGVLSRG